MQIKPLTTPIIDVELEGVEFDSIDYARFIFKSDNDPYSRFVAQMTYPGNVEYMGDNVFRLIFSQQDGERLSEFSSVWVDVSLCYCGCLVNMGPPKEINVTETIFSKSFCKGECGCEYDHQT